jgi:hypothetical protein
MMEQHKLTGSFTGSWLFLQTTFVVSLKATGEKESTTLEVNKGLEALTAEFAKDFPRGVHDEVNRALRALPILSTDCSRWAAPLH